MERELQEIKDFQDLGFKRFEQEGIKGFIKAYKGYHLTIGRHTTDCYAAVIAVRNGIDIAIPGIQNWSWIKSFDKENND